MGVGVGVGVAVGVAVGVGVAADTGEMERNARSRDRPMGTARSGALERSVRKVLARNLGMGVCPMSWSPSYVATVIG